MVTINEDLSVPFKVYPSKGPTVLYLTPRVEGAEEHAAGCEDAVSEQCSLVPCYSFADLASLLTPRTEFIAIHIDFIEQSGVSIAEWSQMFSTMIQLVKYEVPPTKRVIIRKTTNLVTVKHMKKSIVSGILLDRDEYDVNAVKYSLDQMLVKEPFWPKHIIDELPGNTKEKANKNTVLTDRQQEVLHLVCQRGASNKVIAKTLAISENTVKVHISAILKTYGARSRTQLAIFTKSCTGGACNSCSKKGI